MWLLVAALTVPAAACKREPQALIRVAKSDRPGRLAAAACLLDRFPERAQEAIEGWMLDPTAADLVVVVLDRLDVLPEDVALAAARSGLRGPHKASVGQAVWASTNARVRATIAVDDPGGFAGEP